MGKKTSFQQSKKPNILFIVMDGIRPQNLSHTGYKRNTGRWWNMGDAVKLHTTNAQAIGFW